MDRFGPRRGPTPIEAMIVQMAKNGLQRRPPAPPPVVPRMPMPPVPMPRPAAPPPMRPPEMPGGGGIVANPGLMMGAGSNLFRPMPQPPQVTGNQIMQAPPSMPLPRQGPPVVRLPEVGTGDGAAKPITGPVQGPPQMPAGAAGGAPGAVVMPQKPEDGGGIGGWFGDRIEDFAGTAVGRSIVPAINITSGLLNTNAATKPAGMVFDAVTGVMTGKFNEDWKGGIGDSVYRTLTNNENALDYITFFDQRKNDNLNKAFRLSPEERQMVIQAYEQGFTTDDGRSFGPGGNAAYEALTTFKSGLGRFFEEGFYDPSNVTLIGTGGGSRIAAAGTKKLTEEAVRTAAETAARKSAAAAAEEAAVRAGAARAGTTIADDVAREAGQRAAAAVPEVAMDPRIVRVAKAQQVLGEGMYQVGGIGDTIFDMGISPAARLVGKGVVKADARLLGGRGRALADEWLTAAANPANKARDAVSGLFSADRVRRGRERIIGPEAPAPRIATPNNGQVVDAEEARLWQQTVDADRWQGEPTPGQYRDRGDGTFVFRAADAPLRETWQAAKEAATVDEGLALFDDFAEQQFGPRDAATRRGRNGKDYLADTPQGRGWKMIENQKRDFRRGWKANVEGVDYAAQDAADAAAVAAAAAAETEAKRLAREARDSANAARREQRRLEDLAARETRAEQRIELDRRVAEARAETQRLEREARQQEADALTEATATQNQTWRDSLMSEGFAGSSSVESIQTRLGISRSRAKGIRDLIREQENAIARGEAAAPTPAAPSPDPVLRSAAPALTVTSASPAATTPAEASSSPSRWRSPVLQWTERLGQRRRNITGNDSPFDRALNRVGAAIDAGADQDAVEAAVEPWFRRKYQFNRDRFDPNTGQVYTDRDGNPDTLNKSEVYPIPEGSVDYRYDIGHLSDRLAMADAMMEVEALAPLTPNGLDSAAHVWEYELPEVGRRSNGSVGPLWTNNIEAAIEHAIWNPDQAIANDALNYINRKARAKLQVANGAFDAINAQRAAGQEPGEFLLRQAAQNQDHFDWLDGARDTIFEYRNRIHGEPIRVSERDSVTTLTEVFGDLATVTDEGITLGDVTPEDDATEAAIGDAIDSLVDDHGWTATEEPDGSLTLSPPDADVSDETPLDPGAFWSGARTIGEQGIPRPRGMAAATGEGTVAGAPAEGATRVAPESAVASENGAPEVQFGREGIGWVPNQNDIDYFGFRRTMRPDEFLNIAAGGREYLSGAANDSVNGLRDRMLAGDTIANPFLDVEWDAADGVWRATGHEGRNRMAAANLVNPSQQIEVHFFTKGGMRGRNVTDEMRNAPIVSEDGERTLFDGTPTAPVTPETSLAGETDLTNGITVVSGSDNGTYRVLAADGSVIEDNLDPIEARSIAIKNALKDSDRPIRFDDGGWASKVGNLYVVSSRNGGYQVVDQMPRSFADVPETPGENPLMANGGYNMTGRGRGLTYFREVTYDDAVAFAQDIQSASLFTDIGATPEVVPAAESAVAPETGAVDADEVSVETPPAVAPEVAAATDAAVTSGIVENDPFAYVTSNAPESMKQLARDSGYGTVGDNDRNYIGSVLHNIARYVSWGGDIGARTSQMAPTPGDIRRPDVAQFWDAAAPALGTPRPDDWARIDRINDGLRIVDNLDQTMPRQITNAISVSSDTQQRVILERLYSIGVDTDLSRRSRRTVSAEAGNQIQQGIDAEIEALKRDVRRANGDADEVTYVHAGLNLPMAGGYLKGIFDTLYGEADAIGTRLRENAAIAAADAAMAEAPIGAAMRDVGPAMSGPMTTTDYTDLIADEDLALYSETFTNHDQFSGRTYGEVADYYEGIINADRAKLDALKGKGVKTAADAKEIQRIRERWMSYGDIENASKDQIRDMAILRMSPDLDTEFGVDAWMDRPGLLTVGGKNRKTAAAVVKGMRSLNSKTRFAQLMVPWNIIQFMKQNYTGNATQIALKYGLDATGAAMSPQHQREVWQWAMRGADPMDSSYGDLVKSYGLGGMPQGLTDASLLDAMIGNQRRVVNKAAGPAKNALIGAGMTGDPTTWLPGYKNLVRNLNNAAEWSARTGLHGHHLRIKAQQAKEPFIVDMARLTERHGVTETDLRAMVRLMPEAFDGETVGRNVEKIALMRGASPDDAAGLGREVGRQWLNRVRSASDEAVKDVNKALFSYKPSKADDVVSLFTKFHYWQSRAIPFYAEQFLRHPAVAIATMKMVTAAEQQAEAEGAPEWARKYFRIAGLPGAMEFLVDPIQQLGMIDIAMNDSGGYTPDNLSWIGQALNAGRDGRIGGVKVPGLAILPYEYMLAPLNYLGYLGDDPSGLDPLMTYAARKRIGALVEMAQSQGILSPDAADYVNQPIQQMLVNLRGATSGFLPGSSEIAPRDVTASAKNELQALVLEKVLASKAMDYDGFMSTVMRAEGHPTQASSEIVDTIFNEVLKQIDGNGPLYREAYREYATSQAITNTMAATLVSGALGKSEMGLDIAGMTEGLRNAREGKPAYIPGLGKLPTMDPNGEKTVVANATDFARRLAGHYGPGWANNQSVIDRMARAAGTIKEVTQATPQAAPLLIAEAQYHAIAEPAIDEKISTFYDIAFGEKPAMYGITVVNVPELASMDQDGRWTVAEEWLAAQPNAEKIVAAMEMQGIFRDANPEYSRFMEWKSGVGDQWGSALAFRTAAVKVNANYRRYIDNQTRYLREQGKTPSEIATELDRAAMSIDGYMAYMGIQKMRRDPKPLGVGDPLPVASAGATGTFGTDGAGSGSGTSSSWAKRVETAITETHAVVQDINATLVARGFAPGTDILMLTPDMQEIAMREFEPYLPKDAWLYFEYVPWARSQVSAGKSASYAAFIRYMNQEDGQTSPLDAIRTPEQSAPTWWAN